MNTSHRSGTQVPQSTQFVSQNTFSNRPQSRSRSRKCYSVGSNLDFKKSRISERGWNPGMPLSVNRSRISLPYKSEMCLQFQRGKCNYGEKCHFSHSPNGSRRPGFNTVGMKLKECHWFSSGVDCPFGDKCQFLHKCDRKIRSDVGFCRESCPANAVCGGRDRIGNDQWGTIAGGDCDKLTTGKTKLCLKWERFGSCLYGVKCSFAHGKAELQELGSPAEMEYSGYASGSKLASKPISGTSHETGSKMLQLKRKRCFLEWDIEKIRQTYADWMDDPKDFIVPPSNEAGSQLQILNNQILQRSK